MPRAPIGSLVPALALAAGLAWSQAAAQAGSGTSAGAPVDAAAPESAANGTVEDSVELDLKAARTVAFNTDQVTWLSLDVSPDGERLVLEVLGDLYLLPATGGEAQPLTSGMAFDSQPRFSPDGRQIAFVSDRSGAENVWIVGVDGAKPRKLSDNGDMAQFSSPSWAPDGSHVIASRHTWGLRVNELWAYHLNGGKGVRLTRASDDTPVDRRNNSVGAVYGPDGRYLYYAHKTGSFEYNARFPMWQVVRHDLRTDQRDPLTRAQGSAFRPLVSPDGRRLVYGTRHEQSTGLRLRDLETGEDRWLVYPVEHDQQESRFSRDLLPGYAFTPDGQALLFARDGGIRRLEIESGAISEVPFTVRVSQGLGPALRFPYRLGVGPVRSRVVRDPVISPDGSTVAFSAFARIHTFDPASGDVVAVTPEGTTAFHPAWSPDGRWLAYVTWEAHGGHLWRMRSSGRGAPQRLTEVPAYYADPTYSPDGERLVALRASSYERLAPESEFGPPVGSDVIWLPSDGGETRVITPSQGFTRPHFGPEDDRVYLYQGNNGSTGLISVRYDGTDRRTHLKVEGPGLYIAPDDVPSEDIRIAPDGRHALIQHANQLYLAALLNPNLQNLRVKIGSSVVPLVKLTDVGADFFGWDDDDGLYWSTGDTLYRRPLASVDFEDEAEENEDEDENDAENGGDAEAGSGETGDETGEDGNADDPERPLREAHESVTRHEIAVYRPRDVPSGRIALVGATVLPMTENGVPIEDAVVLVEDDRIAAVGPRDAVTIPDGTRRLDVSGHYLMPGFIDTHAHYAMLRRVLDTDNWAFLANLAYGVTTGLDVQPSTIDVLAYQDLIDAGMMLGPRALSTGPGIFSNNDFESLRHARAVLSRYKDSYHVNNLKAYLSGNRQQRQWVVQAARELELMPTTEGALDMKLDLTHVLDGFSGNEHNFPPLTLYPDVVQLVARSGLAYTPTLLVSYGGPFAESWFYTRENPHDDPKLRRFMPYHVIASRTQRGPWFRDEEYVFPELAKQAAKIVRAGGRVGVGAHGQLQGLGYHWELWALARGLEPMEALTAATRHGAEIIGVAQDLGTVEPGKLADLVILQKNPLDDIRHSNTIRYVMKNGELFDGDTLDQLHPAEKSLPDPWWRGQEPPR